jgi:hypothetical protein
MGDILVPKFTTAIQQECSELGTIHNEIGLPD